MKVHTCEQLMNKYSGKGLRFTNTKIPIALSPGDSRDVYNITSPFFYNGSQVLLGRVGYRNSEDSDIIFFRRNSGVWIQDTRFQILEHLQDPFYAYISGKLIIGGIEAYLTEDKEPSYRAIFLRETGAFQFERFAHGPGHMKDIRLLELPDHRILATTRPQGKIGYIILPTLADINPQTLSQGEIFYDQFTDDEWGGTNQLQLLKNGKVGVLSHIAKLDSAGNRHYFCTSFLLDPISGYHSRMKIIATRQNFEAGESKRPDLQDVVFGGGIVRLGNGVARLYCGVGDTEAHCISILDPFYRFEKQSHLKFEKAKCSCDI